MSRIPQIIRFTIAITANPAAVTVPLLGQGFVMTLRVTNQEENWDSQLTWVVGFVTSQKGPGNPIFQLLVGCKIGHNEANAVVIVHRLLVGRHPATRQPVNVGHVTKGSPGPGLVSVGAFEDSQGEQIGLNRELPIGVDVGLVPKQYDGAQYVPILRAKTDPGVLIHQSSVDVLVDASVGTKFRRLIRGTPIYEQILWLHDVASGSVKRELSMAPKLNVTSVVCTPEPGRVMCVSLGAMCLYPYLASSAFRMCSRVMGWSPGA